MTKFEIQKEFSRAGAMPVRISRLGFFSSFVLRHLNWCAAAWLILFAFSVAAQNTSRPANWARKLDARGLGNFYQVTTNLYRGAQPTADGMKQLSVLGVKTVINLRALGSDKDELVGSALQPVRIKMEPWHVDEDEVVLFLRAATDTNNLPVFVHCERGADRTGVMCAMYRVVVCGWSKEQALAEMKNGGFGFNPLWRGLVRFVEKSDVDRIKHRAGLAGG